MTDNNNYLRDETLDDVQCDLAKESVELDSSPTSYDEFDQMITLRAENIATVTPTSHFQEIDVPIETTQTPVEEEPEPKVESESIVESESRGDELEETDVTLRQFLTATEEISGKDHDQRQPRRGVTQSRSVTSPRAPRADEQTGERKSRPDQATQESANNRNVRTTSTTPRAESTRRESEPFKPVDLPNPLAHELPPLPRFEQTTVPNREDEATDAPREESPKDGGSLFGKILTAVFVLFVLSFFVRIGWLVLVLAVIAICIIIHFNLEDNSDNSPH